MIFDTHCHIYLNKDLTEIEIIQGLKDDNIKKIVSIGIDVKTSQKSIDLAKTHRGTIYATLGVHPNDTMNFDIQKTIATFEQMIIENREVVVGIGEIGLDYFRSKGEESLKKQREFFIAQIKLAQKYDLPFIIHSRDAKEDTLDTIKEVGYKNFIYHCYTYDLEYAKKVLAYAPNAKISFSGIVTFKNGKDVQNTAQNIPLKNILVETDAPFLTPEPLRGKVENIPNYTKYNLEKIYNLKRDIGEDIDFERFSEIIYKNSLEVYRIKD